MDYALPWNPIASSLAYHLVKLVERDPYAGFVKSDFDALLESAGIEPSGRHPALGGLATIVTGRRTDSVPPAGESQVSSHTEASALLDGQGGAAGAGGHCKDQGATRDREQTTHSATEAER